jgi:hypothetical protein
VIKKVESTLDPEAQQSFTIEILGGVTGARKFLTCGSDGSIALYPNTGGGATWNVPNMPEAAPAAVVAQAAAEGAAKASIDEFPEEAAEKAAEAAKAVPSYKVLEGAKKCPDGQEKLTKAECIAAAKLFQKAWAGAQSEPLMPAGCYVSLDDKVHFNSVAKAGSGAVVRMLCKDKASPVVVKAAADAATETAIATGKSVDEVVKAAAAVAKEEGGTPDEIAQAGSDAAAEAAIAHGKNPMEVAEAAAAGAKVSDATPEDIKEAANEAVDKIEDATSESRTGVSASVGGGVIMIKAVGCGGLSGNKGEFYLNGVVVPGLPVAVGFNVLELDKQGQQQSFHNFNTHEDASASVAMAEFFNGLTIDTIVVVVVKGDGSQKLGNEAKAAIKQCGAKEIDGLAYQDSYVLIGVKGRDMLAESHVLAAKSCCSMVENKYESPSTLLPIGAVVALAGHKDHNYCSDLDTGIRCDVDAVGPWEIFTVKDAGNGNIALEGGRDKKFCSDMGERLVCSSDSIGASEMFSVSDAKGGNIALSRVSDHKFCTDSGGSGIQCNSATSVGPEQTFTVECLTGCPEPAPLRFPMEFFFGSYSPKQRFEAVLDEGQGYSVHNRGTYGWNCDGDINVDYSAGRRGLDRECGNGLNHFDFDSTCKVHDEYKPVNWELRVPNGAYDVTVDFGCDSREDRTGCMVEGMLACENTEGGPCVFKSRVEVTDGRFTVSGYGQNAKKCHSVSRVEITEAPEYKLMTEKLAKCPSGLYDVNQEDCEKAATLLGKTWQGAEGSVFAPGGCYMSANGEDVLYNDPSHAGPTSTAALICKDKPGAPVAPCDV